MVGMPGFWHNCAMRSDGLDNEPAEDAATPEHDVPLALPTSPPIEVGGPPGPEPTRFGDWEKNGRCIDF